MKAIKRSLRILKIWVRGKPLLLYFLMVPDKPAVKQTYQVEFNTSFAPIRDAMTIENTASIGWLKVMGLSATQRRRLSKFRQMFGSPTALKTGQIPATWFSII